MLSFCQVVKTTKVQVYLLSNYHVVVLSFVSKEFMKKEIINCLLYKYVYLTMF